MIKKIFSSILIMTIIIFSAYAYAQDAQINIEYDFREKSLSKTISTTVDLNLNCALLADKLAEGISTWESQADTITGSYEDRNGARKTANYKASFAGWKLIAINNQNLSSESEYIYPDNDYVYFDDEPFVAYNGSITNLTFRAVWGKTIYVRDKYNFHDIRDVFGFGHPEWGGDVGTAKIAWDTSVEYSNDSNSGATKESPVSTMEKAYELLDNSFGGQICIVNHVTLEGEEAYQPYSPNYENVYHRDYLHLGENKNISGVVTISGKDLGSGPSVENKSFDGFDYKNGDLIFKNTRGNGRYIDPVTGQNKVYESYYMRPIFRVSTVIEDLNFPHYYTTVDIAKTQRIASLYLCGSFNHRFVLEETAIPYQIHSGTDVLQGVDITNWSHGDVTINGNSYHGMRDHTMRFYIGGTYFSYPEGNNPRKRIQSTDNIYLTCRITQGSNIWIGAHEKYSDNEVMNNAHISIESHIGDQFMGTFNNFYNVTGNIMTFRIEDAYFNYYSPISNVGSATFNKISHAFYGTGKRLGVGSGNPKNAQIIEAYLGGYNDKTDGHLVSFSANTKAVLDGQRIKNVYGGGNQTAVISKGDIEIDINSGKYDNIYGGGLGGYVGTPERRSNINININGGQIDNIYGGGSGGLAQISYQGYSVDLSSYSRVGQYVWNTSHSNKWYLSTNSTLNYDAPIYYQNVDIKDGNTIVGNYEVIKYNYLSPNYNDEDYNSYWRSYYAYAVTDALVNGDITLNIGKNAVVTGNIFGGGQNGAIKGDVTLNILDGVNYNKNIYAGGEGINTTFEQELLGMNLLWTSSTDDDVLTVEKFDTACMEEGTIFRNAPPAGDYQEKFLIKRELLDKFSPEPIKLYTSSIKRLGLIDGNTTINMNGNSVKAIYGGSLGEIASVSGTTTVNINKGTIEEVYGGGDKGSVENSIVNMNGGIISNAIYGGCNNSEVIGSTSVIVNSGIIPSVYGGGNSGDVYGNTNVIINGGTIVESLYGGGNKGKVLTNSSVTINQGTLRDVYGGGNLGVVGRNTNVVVGGEDQTAVIYITNLLYGGGKGTGADYNTVDGNATVLIKGYNTFVNNYGSLTTGKVSGSIDVTFKDYWSGNSTNKYKLMNGIDRATNVYFENSYVTLENKGANGQLEGIKEITNLYVPEGSGLKVSADGELKGNFEGGGIIYLYSGKKLIIDGNILYNTDIKIMPELTNGVYVIKGKIENPYVIVKGSDLSPNIMALTSVDDNYEILKDIQTGTGYLLYYLDDDVILQDRIENIVINIEDVHYTDSASTWGKEDVSIPPDGKFSSNIDTIFEYSAARNEIKYSNVKRGVSLVSNDVVVAFPKNTIIKLYDNGALYVMKLQSPQEIVYLSDLVKDGTGINYNELRNVQSNAEIILENENSIKYKYSEKFRMIVDFSGVTDVNEQLRIKPYNFMMNYFNVNNNSTVKIAEMENKADNIVKIEKTRLFTGEIVPIGRYFETNGIISFDTNINSDASVIDDSLVGAKMYMQVALYQNDAVFELIDVISTMIDREEVEHTSSNFTGEVMEHYTGDQISLSNRVDINMKSVSLASRLKEGNCIVRVSYYVGSLQNRVFSMQKELEIRKPTYGVIYANVSNGSTLTGTGLLKLTSSSPNRTITIHYVGELDQPYCIFQLQKSDGSGGYSTVANSFTDERMNIIQAVQDLTLRRGSIARGTYKLNMTLYDYGGTEKAKEALIFNVE